MSLATPDKIRTFQRKLYVKAKAEPAFRFYLLYDKIYRADILLYAWRLAKANNGAPGVDGVTFAMIEAAGVGNWLSGLAEDLGAKRYKPQPVRKVLLPKPDGGMRPLGIPTIWDRVVQTAAKLVLEPIFEADLSPRSYGYRPKRSALDAIRVIHSSLSKGYTQVVDADLSKYFETIPHGPLMRSVAKRVADRHVLALIKAWLKVPVEDCSEKGKRVLTGGRRSSCGTPQGGVISPLLANLYMNRFLKHWTRTGQTFQLRARIVVYADDFVILSRGKADEALRWSQDVLTRMGLTLNMSKTSIKDARTEPFDFLGYSFGPHRRWKDGQVYMGASPSKKSVARLRGRVREVLRPSARPWPEIRNELNAVLRGWSAYFSHGARYKAHTAIDNHVVQNVRGFLTRRHKVHTRGTRRFSYEAIFGEFGVLSLRQSWQPYHQKIGVKSVGKPDAGNPPVRFDERGGETGPR